MLSWAYALKQEDSSLFTLHSSLFTFPVNANAIQA